MQSYDGEKLAPEKTLIVAAGGGRKLAENAAAIADFLKAGGHLLALGLDEQEANRFLPFQVRMRKAEHIASYFEPPAGDSLLSGVAPADVYNRDPRKLPLVSAGATVLGDGVLAQARSANVAFFQFPPYSVSSRGGNGAFIPGTAQPETYVPPHLVRPSASAGQHGRSLQQRPSCPVSRCLWAETSRSPAPRWCATATSAKPTADGRTAYTSTRSRTGTTPTASSAGKGGTGGRRSQCPPIPRTVRRRKNSPPVSSPACSGQGGCWARPRLAGAVHPCNPLRR